MNPVILIPSFNPPAAFVDLGLELEKIFNDIVVVNDGSAQKYRPIFHTLAQSKIIVKHHETNRGKGNALKTGFSYIAKHFPNRYVVTVDSDGQHSIKDILAVSEALHTLGEKSVVLGKRNISQSNAPLASKMGNALTTFFIETLFKRSVPDTQSGLRGIGHELLGVATKIDGKRYEYETAFLIYCLRKKIPIVQTPIKAIYKDNNRNSHFYKWRDSYLIYQTILQQFLKTKYPQLFPVKKEYRRQ